MPKKNEYMIILFENQKQKKIIKRSRNKKKILLDYKKMLNQSKKVKIPRLYANKNTDLVRCTYELALVSTSGRIKQTYSNKKLITNKNKYIINKINFFNYEENFYIRPENKYFTYQKIKKRIESIPQNSSVYIINNNLIVESFIRHEIMISCKTQSDAQRLHDALMADKKVNMCFLSNLSNEIIKKKKDEIISSYKISYRSLFKKKSKY